MLNMSEKILVVNPGSTSTKIALFDGEEEIFRKNIRHTTQEINQFHSIYEQLGFRYEHILQTLAETGYKPEEMDIVMGRGGLLPPVKGGGYLVDDAMIDLIMSDKLDRHASNLGAPLASRIAKLAGVSAYIYDSVRVDELMPAAKITGIPEITRASICHVLNSKEVTRRWAQEQGKRYEDVRVVVAHLGGGISVGAHVKGRIIDSLADDGGAFGPERGGSVPTNYIVEMCYSGEYTKEQMRAKVRGLGGLKALLGTADCEEIEARIAAGDERAALVYEAQILQIAKGIGTICPVLAGDIDAIILTGGIAHSRMITEGVTRMVEFMAPVVVVQGEFELEALAAGGLRILRGEEEINVGHWDIA